MFLLGWSLALLFMGQVYSQDANCDFVQNLAPGTTYSVQSPNYPNNYTAGVQCRWILICPTGYNCRLDCPVIALPQVSVEPIMFDGPAAYIETGDPQLNAAEVYCGRGSLTAVSRQQRLSLGLITSNSSPGGNFLCQARAQLSSIIARCRCGERKQNRIVGGHETGVNEYKMMAGLVDKRISQITCGGVIITSRHVLTAAHCLLDQVPSNFAVIVGEHNTSTGSDTSAARAYNVNRFIIHPNFTESNNDYDIAILTVDVIEFNDAVGPVCLPFKFFRNNLTGANVTILGWGTLFPGGPTSDVLMEVVVKVISQTECRQSEPNLTNQQICTYSPGKDACQYDSGGPLLYNDPSTGLLFNVGIVSYGRLCASREPGINTRVTALLDWIISSTQYNSFCVK